MKHFDKLQADYIASRRQDLELLSRVELADMQSIAFNLSELEHDQNELRQQLEPLMNLHHVLYYFEMAHNGLNKKLLKKAKTMKKKKKPKLPRLNDDHWESTILYVGKTAKSGFGKRMLQHFGYSSSLSTYALHLAHWAKGYDLNMKLTSTGRSLGTAGRSGKHPACWLRTFNGTKWALGIQDVLLMLAFTFSEGLADRIQAKRTGC